MYVVGESILVDAHVLGGSRSVNQELAFTGESKLVLMDILPVFSLSLSFLSILFLFFFCVLSLLLLGALLG